MCETVAVLHYEVWPLEAMDFEYMVDDYDLYEDGQMYKEVAPGRPLIMSLIEGVGDEVTVSVIIFLLALLLIIAWLSTQVHDQLLIRVIVLDRRRLQQLISRITGRHVAEIRNGTIQIQTADPDSAQELEEQQNAASAVDTSDGSVTTPAVNKTESGDKSPDDSVASVPASGTVPSDLDSNLPLTQRTVTSSGEERKKSPELRHRAARLVEGISLAVASDSTDNSPIRSSVTSGPDVTSQQTDQSQPRAESQASDPSETLPQTDTDMGREAPSTETPESVNVDSPETVDVDDRKAGHIRIKLKYLDDRHRMVQAKPEDTIGDFKRKHFESELADNMKIRFVFRGQELRQESSSLRSYHVEDNSVIHCLLNRVTQQEDAANQARGMELDIGTLMFPLFGVILLLIWYCRFTYKQYFNAMSTLSLFGITFLFLVAVLATFRLGDTHEPEVTVQTGNVRETHDHQD